MTTLPGEDPAERARLLDDLLARHRPFDAVERFWVEEVATALSRLRRLRSVRMTPDLALFAARVERGLLDAEARLAELVASRPPAAANASEPAAAAPEAEVPDLPPLARRLAQGRGRRPPRRRAAFRRG